MRKMIIDWIEYFLFWRRPLRKAMPRLEEAARRRIFKDGVIALKQRWGLPAKSLSDIDVEQFPVEIAEFAVNFAGEVWESALNSRDPLSISKDSQKTAIAVLAVQAIHAAARLAGLADKDKKALIIENVVSLLHAKRMVGEGDDEAALRLLPCTSDTYAAVTASQRDLLVQIDVGATDFLMNQRTDQFRNLVQVWKALVQFIEDKRNPATESNNL